MSKKGFKLIGFILASIVVLLLTTLFSGGIGRPVIYRMTGGYVGWVGVVFENPACVPLKTESWYVVISIDSAGMGCTSSSVPEGWRYFRYEYQYPDGTRQTLSESTAVWPRGVSGPWSPRIETIFVGSKAEFEESYSQVRAFIRKVEQKLDLKFGRQAEVIQQ